MVDYNLEVIDGDSHITRVKIETGEKDTIVVQSMVVNLEDCDMFFSFKDFNDL